MAAVLPANPTLGGGSGIGGPPNPTTYIKIFSVTTNNPYSSNYVEIMQAFATTLQPLPNGAAITLANKVFSKSKSELQAYLVLMHVDNSNFIQVLHQPSTLQAPLSSDNLDQRFRFLGDC